MKKWLSILRIKHWVKNLFVIAPIFFAKGIFDNVWVGIGGFFAFSFMASSIYLINDWFDQSMDKQNPTKTKNISISSFSSTSIIVVTSLLFISSVSLGLYLSSILPLFIYFVMNILYSVKLKEIPYLEMLIVSFGFILRVFFGGEISQVIISDWLFLEVFVLTLLIIGSKRMKELNYYLTYKIYVRKVLQYYSKSILLTQLILFSMGIVIIYTAYCFNPLVIGRTNPNIWITIPLVISGVLRFLQLTLRTNNNLNPVNIFFKDIYTIAIVLAWSVLWIFLLYE